MRIKRCSKSSWRSCHKVLKVRYPKTLHMVVLFPLNLVNCEKRKSETDLDEELDAGVLVGVLPLGHVVLKR